MQYAFCPEATKTKSTGAEFSPIIGAKICKRKRKMDLKMPVGGSICKNRLLLANILAFTTVQDYKM